MKETTQKLQYPYLVITMDLTNFNENNWAICLIKIASSNEEATVVIRRTSCLIEYIKERGGAGGVVLLQAHLDTQKNPLVTVV